MQHFLGSHHPHNRVGLAFVDEKGKMFGEEYTLVLVADYLLEHTKSHVVSNMSSSKALRDLAESKGSTYSASAVGEVNVVNEMKATNSILGGEGNGGIILPELHYGRDALVGIALALTHLAKTGKTLSELKASYPQYFMGKQKIELTPGLDVDALLATIAGQYQHEVNVGSCPILSRFTIRLKVTYKLRCHRL